MISHLDSIRAQALFARGFRESETQLTVDLDSTSDHAIRELVEFHLRALRGHNLAPPMARSSEPVVLRTA